MWVRSLDQKDPLTKGMATSPVFLPGESHRQSGLVGYSPWGHKTVRHDLVTKQTKRVNTTNVRENTNRNR